MFMCACFCGVRMRYGYFNNLYNLTFTKVKNITIKITNHNLSNNACSLF